MSEFAKCLKNLFFIPEEHINKPQPNIFQIFCVRPRLVILLIVNYFIFWFNASYAIEMNVIIAFVYVLFIMLCLSDFAEYFLRLIGDVRRVATNTEKEQLLELFDYAKARGAAYSKMIDYDLKLYIIDSVAINAFTIGKHTIAVTRGLMSFMTDEEIEAIIAHEMGHIINGDGQVGILVSLASNIYLWSIMLAAKILRLLETFLGGNSFFGSLIGFVRNIIEIGRNYAITLLTILVSSTSRKEEFKADKVAYKLGYGEPLLSALYKFYDMEISDKKKLLEKLQSSHPKTAYRIEALENMCYQEECQEQLIDEPYSANTFTQTI